MSCLEEWVKAQQLDILIWDTINSVLAATGDPNSEVSVSRFLDAIALLPLKGSLLVRHDSKPSRDTENRHSNQLVRGSNRLVEDASLVVHLKRLDKAASKVQLRVGKLRNAPKPEPVDLWFDASTFRLTPLPPVAAVLEDKPLTREKMLSEGFRRFGLKTRTMDEQRRELSPCINEAQDGHKRVLSLNRRAVPKPESPVSVWWRLLKPETPSQQLQHCISTNGIPDSDEQDLQSIAVAQPLVEVVSR
jgi:hypothetical protein